ncbi:heme ABC transporter ATP-binding protein [Caldimonas brevitalea]|uniref:Hemin ABC transporter ATP-binding protein n=1 Tax=Caldimonas brevitalea TaxID=413882 RepID=A0A0G3BCT4_9BURK|nr:heme ABC transporter ATP-binding protein [Caldimonas brevitalea]AKJ27194.1 hemin ABC transporter ATP-binding protein [Caldimonas brevitalea]
MLVAQGLGCARGPRQVLSQVDLALKAGEVVGVLGANGAGKSSLLACLAGELQPCAGRVTLDGRPLPAWSPVQLARRRAVLPQTPTLAFDLQVAEVVAMGAYPHPSLSPAEVRRLCAQALATVEGTPFTERRYLQLSGGEQQRVQFARVLLQVLAGQATGAGQTLLLDEPTASLDPLHQWQLMAAAASLARQHGCAVLTVLHDVNLAARWCDRLLLLSGGRTVASGPPAHVLTEATLEQVYGLPARVVEHPGLREVPLVLFASGPAAAAPAVARTLG